MSVCCRPNSAKRHRAAYVRFPESCSSARMSNMRRLLPVCLILEAARQVWGGAEGPVWDTQKIFSTVRLAMCNDRCSATWSFNQFVRDPVIGQSC